MLSVALKKLPENATFRAPWDLNLNQPDPKICEALLPFFFGWRRFNAPYNSPMDVILEAFGSLEVRAAFLGGCTFFPPPCWLITGGYPPGFSPGKSTN